MSILTRNRTLHRVIQAGLIAQFALPKPVVELVGGGVVSLHLAQGAPLDRAIQESDVSAYCADADRMTRDPGKGGGSFGTRSLKGAALTMRGHGEHITPVVGVGANGIRR